MKTKIKVLKEITIDRITLILPVRYEEEDIPNDFPLRQGDVWQATVEMDTGRILNWPDNPRFQECNLRMKVVDEGTYILFDDSGREIARLEQEYVPNGVVPGEYGDTVDLDIKDGVITNWPKKPDVRRFFGEDED